jgi:hypothetical protein
MNRISTVAAEPTGSGVSAATSPAPTKGVQAAPIHPLRLRATHWLNAIAVVLMATGGWRTTGRGAGTFTPAAAGIAGVVAGNGVSRGV